MNGMLEWLQCNIFLFFCFFFLIISGLIGNVKSVGMVCFALYTSIRHFVRTPIRHKSLLCLSQYKKEVFQGKISLLISLQQVINKV